MKIVVLNVGSGSQRCTLFDLPRKKLPPAGECLEPVWEASTDATTPGQPKGKLLVKIRLFGRAGLRLVRAGQRPALPRPSHPMPPARNETETPGPRDAAPPILSSRLTPRQRTARLLRLLWTGPGAPLRGPQELDRVAHRIVHGGARYDRAVRLDARVDKTIARFAAFAPLHNPPGLAGIRAVRAVCGPRVPQFAVFDTAFHRTLPPAAATYAGPQAWLGEGIRRYGFHGTNFRWVAARAERLLPRPRDGRLRLIICHLGGGCSLCATVGGRSVATTMGFTPLDGIAMTTRSGALDPGILLYLQRRGWTAARLEKLLNQESGLKGLSGLSGDTRVLRRRIAAGHPHARLAWDVFVHRLQAGIGEMLAALGDRPHAIVFTDAIAEDEPPLRAAACAPFAFLGLRLDPRENFPHGPDRDLATKRSPVRALLVQSREAWQIAQECVRLQ